MDSEYIETGYVEPKALGVCDACGEDICAGDAYWCSYKRVERLCKCHMDQEAADLLGFILLRAEG